MRLKQYRKVTVKNVVYFSQSLFMNEVGEKYA